jgi:CheY-like chemotaxis protein
MEIKFFGEDYGDFTYLKSRLKAFGLRLGGVFQFDAIEGFLNDDIKSGYRVFGNDLVILDSQFKGGHARDLIRIIRQRPDKMVPIFVYTGSADEVLLQTLLDAGATRIFRKDPSGATAGQLIEHIRFLAQAEECKADPEVIPEVVPGMARDASRGPLSPEGHYESLQEADAHVHLFRQRHKNPDGSVLRDIELDYFFGASERKKLKTFIKAMTDHGFVRCDARFIDEDEDSDEDRFHWVPSKRLAVDGAVLLAEFVKYRELADKHGIIYNGVTCSTDQGSGR